jgi:hypothetical protein
VLRACYVLRVTCYVLRVACCVLRVACCVLRVACCVLRAMLRVAFSAQVFFDVAFIMDVVLQ